MNTVVERRRKKLSVGIRRLRPKLSAVFRSGASPQQLEKKMAFFCRIFIWLFPEPTFYDSSKYASVYRECKSVVVEDLRQRLAELDPEYELMVTDRDRYLVGLGPETPRTGPLGLSRPDLHVSTAVLGDDVLPDQRTLDEVCERSHHEFSMMPKRPWDPFDVFKPNR